MQSTATAAPWYRSSSTMTREFIAPTIPLDTRVPTISVTCRAANSAAGCVCARTRACVRGRVLCTGVSVCLRCEGTCACNAHAHACVHAYVRRHVHVCVVQRALAHPEPPADGRQRRSLGDRRLRGRAAAAGAGGSPPRRRHPAGVASTACTRRRGTGGPGGSSGRHTRSCPHMLPLPGRAPAAAKPTASPAPRLQLTWVRGRSKSQWWTGRRSGCRWCRQRDRQAAPSP